MAPVCLRVGGKPFETTLGTLQQCEYFDTLVSGTFGQPLGDEDGCVVVDRSPALFEVLLDCWRTPLQRPRQSVIADLKESLLAEVDFYGCDWLKDKLKGKISRFDMRPQDREILGDEEAGRMQLLDVFAREGRLVDKEANNLYLPLLFEERDPSKRPAMTCKDADMARARLNDFSAGVVDRLLSITGICIAGGAVLDALLNGKRECTDLDIFLIGAPEDGMSKLRSIYEAVRLNTLEAQGCHKTLLVTRTSASVTILSSATPTPPPVQIVLHTYESIEELLSRFDVDCCACCFDMERFWMTPRCKRALEFKANVVDHSFSTSVCRALKGNANRSSDPLGRDRKIFLLESVCLG